MFLFVLKLFADGYFISLFFRGFLGFLICAYLIEIFDWSPEMAVNAFSAVRGPGKASITDP